ncbi:hypothetical protein H696_01106 [Fonticula alba]|uniref:Class I SAM-dependent methyltransferase n=1 Tax=Fonticula alba TaxID=691883 RepID=A0A058ZDZ5_FONAL|nr:hypothetical protein H696_01106 [Fonticula alba]KCV71682.1 hypothetical protein H696_01106 [Fonticula alba]|eukprot:XP_009493260.1 hypothetical protein H696_01106 [Fonticula alba]
MSTQKPVASCVLLFGLTMAATRGLSAVLETHFGYPPLGPMVYALTASVQLGLYAILQWSLKEFSVDDVMFAAIDDLLTPVRKSTGRKPAILEFGSGPGTARLCQDYTVYSVEHDAKWVNYIAASHYIHAPIVNFSQHKKPSADITMPESDLGWYDMSVISKKLPATYDVILVDGPPGHIGRHGFLLNLDSFDINVPIIIDDVNRDAELDLLKQVAKRVGRPYAIRRYSGKAFGLIPAPGAPLPAW